MSPDHLNDAPMSSTPDDDVERELFELIERFRTDLARCAIVGFAASGRGFVAVTIEASDDERRGDRALGIKYVPESEPSTRGRLGGVAALVTLYDPTREMIVAIVPATRDRLLWFLAAVGTARFERATCSPYVM